MGAARPRLPGGAESARDRKFPTLRSAQRSQPEFPTYRQVEILLSIFFRNWKIHFSRSLTRVGVKNELRREIENNQEKFKDASVID